MKDHSKVYTERAALAVAFARLALSNGWAAGVKPATPEQWTVLYVDLPGGEQVSWHIAMEDEPLLAGLPPYPGQWDGKFTGRNPDWCQLIPMQPPPRSQGIAHELGRAHY